MQPPPPVFTDAPPDSRGGHAAGSVHEHAPHRHDGGHRSGYWQSGVNGETKPSFVLNATAGYLRRRGRALPFRLGGLLGYTFLGANEDKSNVVRIVPGRPRLEIRLTQSGRLYSDVGFGLASRRCLASSRAQAAGAEQMLVVNGAQAWCRASAPSRLSRDPDISLFRHGADEQPEEGSLLPGHRRVSGCSVPASGWAAVDARQ
jgi:hypothetical protein